jgi:CheY-like chemotaxis protein
LLDVITSAAGKRSPVEQCAENVQSSLPGISKLRILLVEDGKANQVLAKRILQKWGHSVEIAENGEEAIACWTAGDYDLILMDVQMPVMDGIAATRRIRDAESRTHSHIPIVAMTAHAMKGDRTRCIEAGMDGYLAKPFRQQELNSVLTDLFAAKSREAAQAQRDVPLS